MSLQENGINMIKTQQNKIDDKGYQEDRFLKLNKSNIQVQERMTSTSIPMGSISNMRSPRERTREG